METKRCSKCGEVRGVEKFSLYYGKYYLSMRNICHTCRGKKYRKDNPEYMKKYYKAHQDHIMRKSRQSYQINYNKIKEKARQNLYGNYLRQLLRQGGLENITEELIELKREQILLFRNLKQLKEVYYEPDDSNSQRIEPKNAASY